ASLPAEYFIDYQFHTDAINLAFPEYRDIPYSTRKTTRPERRPLLSYFQEVANGTLESTYAGKAWLLLHGLWGLVSRDRKSALGWRRAHALYLISLDEIRAIPNDAVNITRPTVLEET